MDRVVGEGGRDTEEAETRNDSLESEATQADRGRYLPVKQPRSSSRTQRIEGQESHLPYVYGT